MYFETKALRKRGAFLLSLQKKEPIFAHIKKKQYLCSRLRAERKKYDG